MSAVSHRARSIMRELKIFNCGWNGDVCRTLPKIADEDMQDIFYALDDSGDFKINEEEFADLCSAISLKFEKAEEPAYIEHFPRIYNSKFFKELKQFVRSKHFEYIIMGMLLANLVTVIIETTVCPTSSLIVIFCALIGSC
jgi:hypothetical protein